jgi:AcrR family transcriptional regulator
MNRTSTAARRRERSLRGEGEHLREELVEAAIALLAETGDLRALTLRATARRVGIAATSIYLHFPDLESLTEAAISRAFDRFDAARNAAGRRESKPGAILRARARAYCRFALENPGLYRVLFDAERPVTERSRAAFETLVSAIARCEDAGHALEDDAEHLAELLWAALHGVASLRINRPQFPWRASLDEDVDRVVAAIVGLRR